MRCGAGRRIVNGFYVAAMVLVTATAARAQTLGPWVSCNEYLLPARMEDGQRTGPEECWMRETPFEFEGKSYRRLDIGLNGSVQGYAVKEGTRAKYFTDRPEFVFVQWGHTGWLKGTARYHASRGVGVTLLLPKSAATWNSKLYVHVHGAGTCVEAGRRRMTAADPLGDMSRYNERMIAKGYAVAATGPAATNSAGLDTIPSPAAACTEVKLSDGTTLQNLNVTDHAQFHVDLVKLAKNVVKTTLGRAPQRTYWYGHSSGARVNRLINYIPELNTDADQKPLIDGFLGDDPAAGQWVPAKYEGNIDVLFDSDQERSRFTKQIDVAHHLYDDVKGDPIPPWVSNVTIINKRTSAKLFRDKGLNDRYRMYEVRGVSHSGGDYKGEAPGVRGLDLSPLIDGLIDVLAAWVEDGKAPPPTKSDWAELGDANRDGVNEHEAIALPDVACPTGVFHTYPVRTGEGPTPFAITLGTPILLRPKPGDDTGVTGFAPFDGTGAEPVDGRGIFVDMNRNGYHDQRESMTEAWRRLGLLKPAESFSQAKYTECVRSAVAGLRRDGLLSAEDERKFNSEAERKASSSQAAWRP